MAREINLRQQVYNQIKQDIITCKLAPGEQLSEQQFVEELKVSKTPIREALTSLVQDGLVEYKPNRGFMVTTVSAMDINEIFEARIFMEVELFRLAITRITDAQIDDLQELSKVTDDMNNPDNAAKFLESNLKFHVAIAALARNSRLLRQYENLMNEAQRLFYLDIINHHNEFLWGHGHEEVINNLRKRDEAAGVTAIQTALENARKRILGA